jgi:hypothetical protein
LGGVEKEEEPIWLVGLQNKRILKLKRAALGKVIQKKPLKSSTH